MAGEVVTVTINTEQIIRELRGIEDLALKGISRGLNDSAFELRRFWQADMNVFLKNPTGFTKKIFVKKSSPKNLVATTFIPPRQSEYLSNLIEGGVRRPGGIGTLQDDILVPVKARLNKFGNLPLGPQRWLGKLETRIRNTFVGAPRGDKGAVYQRIRGGRLKLLAIFVKSIDYDKRLPLDKTAETFAPQADTIIQANIDRLLSK